MNNPSALSQLPRFGSVYRVNLRMADGSKATERFEELYFQHYACYERGNKPPGIFAPDLNGELTDYGYFSTDDAAGSDRSKYENLMQQVRSAHPDDAGFFIQKFCDSVNNRIQEATVVVTPRSEESYQFAIQFDMQA